MKLAYMLLIICLTIFIIVGSVCRLKIMHPDTNKHGWAIMYFMMAGFAGFALIDSLKGVEPSLTIVFGLCAWALNLYNTHGLWGNKSPDATLKKG